MSPDDEDLPQLDIDDLLLAVGEWVDYLHSMNTQGKIRGYYTNLAFIFMNKAYKSIERSKKQLEIALEERER